MIYGAQFTGCRKGAIGITYLIATMVEADSPEAAGIRLYDRYDHIGDLTLTPQPLTAGTVRTGTRTPSTRVPEEQP